MGCHYHHSVVVVIRVVQKLEGLEEFCGSVFWYFLYCLSRLFNIR